MAGWLTDARHVLRALRARLGHTLALTSIVALGIGLLAAIFALADPYVLRPLPYLNDDELVLLNVDATRLRDGESVRLDHLQQRSDLFQDVAAYESEFATLVRPDEPLDAVLVAVTPNYFRVLGVRVPGSTEFNAGQPADDVPVVLMEGRLPALGRPVEGDLFAKTGGGRLRVAGRLPDAFHPPDPRQLDTIDGFVPFSPEVVAQRERGRSTVVRMVARLRHGVEPDTVERVLADARLPRQRIPVQAVRVRDALTRDVRPLAGGAMAAGVLIFLISVANTANLMIVRATWRRREIWARVALGARTADLVRLWVIESAAVVGTACGAGLLLAGSILAVARQVMPDAYLTLGAPEVTSRVVAMIAISAVIVLTTASAAALLTAGSSRAARGQAATAEQRSRTMRMTFTAAQCALAVVLAIGAAMLGQSYWNLIRQDTGYDENAVTLRVYFPSRGAALSTDVDQALQRVRAIPGVRAAGASTVVLGEMTSWSTFDVRGRNVEVHTRSVTPGFFDAAGIRLREGRLLSSADSQTRSIVVNDAFVRAFLQPGAALGTVISERRMPPSEIVGVVQDVFDRNLTTRPEPRLYSPWEPDQFGLVFTVRSNSDAVVAAEAVRRAIKGVHPRASVGSAETIGQRLADTVRDRTFAVLVLTVFGAAGAGIALAGVGAMVAFTVARRSREIAIRMVVGASRHDVRRLVVRDARLAATIGGTAGLIVGRWLSTFLESQVYGLEAGNWLTALGATIVVTILTTVAALGPTRRALTTSPMLALRAE